MTLSETKYKNVFASTEDNGGGVVIPNGEKWAPKRIRLNGASPDVFVSVIFDHGGPSERVFISSRGDIDAEIDPYEETSMQITGDGSKKVIILITNNGLTQSPLVGGSFVLEKIT